MCRPCAVESEWNVLRNSGEVRSSVSVGWWICGLQELLGAEKGIPEGGYRTYSDIGGFSCCTTGASNA